MAGLEEKRRTLRPEMRAKRAARLMTRKRRVFMLAIR